ncbi:hypothetical protein C8R44DRAFT_731379 [Mycena epipterygia]|nr:hypothetical protein C8R44DRAFT_731379 [Mycena epipterygia]
MEPPTTLPRTTHMLKHDQRVRLLRSTRKVEALLGETPLFVDSPRAAAFEFPVPPNPINGIRANENNGRPAAFIYAATPRSSSLGVYHPDSPGHASSSRANSHPPAHPRPLLAVRVPPTADADPPPSASSLSFSLAFDRPRTSSDSSLASSLAPADEARRRRTRKMARVVRTLGENIPTELVFPVPSTPVRARTSSGGIGRQRSKLSRNPSSAAPRGRVHSDARDLDAADDSDSSASAYSALSGGEWVRVEKPPVQSFSAPYSSSASKPPSTSFSASNYSAPPPSDPRAGYMSSSSAPVRPAPPSFIPASSSPPSTSLPSAPPQGYSSFYSSSSSPSPPSFSSPPAPTKYAAYEPAPAPSISSSPVRYDRGTPVRGVSYAVFPPLAASALAPLSSSSDPRTGPSVGYSTDEPYNGVPSSRVPTSSYAPPSSRMPSQPPPTSPHVKFDPGVGHDRASPPSNSSSSSPSDETRVGYDRGTHRTEKGWSGEWVTGVDGSGKGVQSMDDVAKKLRGLRLR